MHQRPGQWYSGTAYSIVGVAHLHLARVVVVEALGAE